MMPRRLRAPLLVVSLLLLLTAAAAGIALAMRPAVATAPLDPTFPNEQGLIAAGLSGTPAPGQSTSPFAVDRVLVDGTATYVQYHTSVPTGPQGDPLPSLSDDRGLLLTGDAHSGTTFSSGWAAPLPLPSWLPWHPRTVRHGVVILPPLPPTTRAAVLQFGGPGGPPGPGGGETVRVALDLRALARRRLVSPGATARAAGLTLTLQELDFTHLIYTYASPPNGAPAPFPQRLLLADRAGHVVSVTTLDSACSSSVSGPGSCSQRVVFPPQRAGARLTLTIPAFGVYGRRGIQRVLHGPWRLPLVIP